MRKMNQNYRVNLGNIVWGSLNKKILLIKIPSAPNIYSFLIALETNVFELKGAGLEIWKMLIKNYPTQKILKNLKRKYPFISKELIQSDATKFIKQLKDQQIINETP